MSDPLALTPEAMRALGYQAVDLLVDRLADPTIPVLRRATRGGDGGAPGGSAPGRGALDWGAGYGYARSATVTASEPLRLLVLPPRALHELMRTTPTVARRVQAAARERLRRT